MGQVPDGSGSADRKVGMSGLSSQPELRDRSSREIGQPVQPLAPVVAPTLSRGEAKASQGRQDDPVPLPVHNGAKEGEGPEGVSPVGGHRSGEALPVPLGMPHSDPSQPLGDPKGMREEKEEGKTRSPSFPVVPGIPILSWEDLKGPLKPCHWRGANELRKLVFTGDPSLAVAALIRLPGVPVGGFCLQDHIVKDGMAFCTDPYYTDRCQYPGRYWEDWDLNDLVKLRRYSSLLT